MDRRTRTVLAVSGVLLMVLVAVAVQRVTTQRGRTAGTVTLSPAAVMTALARPSATALLPGGTPGGVAAGAVGTPAAALPTPIPRIDITGSPGATPPPPLNNVEFPAQAVPYPVDWPDDLRLPSPFTPLAMEGNLGADGRTRVWSATFRLVGSREQASAQLVAFFQARDYQVRQRSSANGAVLLTFERPDGARGGSVLYDRDAATPDAVRLLLTGRAP